MQPSRVAAILAQLRSETGPSQALPDQLCAAALHALPVGGVAVALMTAEGRNGGILAATDGTARQLEELQFALGEGPCIDASKNFRPVLQSDLSATASNRWPAFGPAALALGVCAIFAFPLQVGAIRLGILDLYRGSPGGLNNHDYAEALAFADAALVVLLGLQDGDRGDAASLAEVTDRRAEVHQATGMVAAQLEVSLGHALLRLRAHAFAVDRRLVDVAADVVNRTMRFDHSESGSSTLDRH